VGRLGCAGDIRGRRLRPGSDRSPYRSAAATRDGEQDKSEGSEDALSPELTPPKSLAVNLATGTTGLVAVLLLVWMTRVPWRALFSSRRAFDRRLGVRMQRLRGAGPG
jgi:hypothetical protein